MLDPHVSHLPDASAIPDLGADMNDRGIFDKALAIEAGTYLAAAHLRDKAAEDIVLDRDVIDISIGARQPRSDVVTSSWAEDLVVVETDNPITCALGLGEGPRVLDDRRPWGANVAIRLLGQDEILFEPMLAFIDEDQLVGEPRPLQASLQDVRRALIGGDDESADLGLFHRSAV